jgi:Ankyrin repeats (3 copies)
LHGASSADLNVMLSRKTKIFIALIPIVGLAIVFFPLAIILLQDLIGALINPPFAHCEVMDKARLETALRKGFTVSAGCCAERMIGECSIARRNSTPLLFAVENENLEAVQLLLEHGADVNQSSDYGYALAAAASRGRTDLVKLLLARDIQAPARDAALRIGAHAGQTEAVKLILERTEPAALGPSCAVLACSLVSDLEQIGSPALEKQRELFLHVIQTCVDPNMICRPERLLSLLARNDAHAPLIRALLDRGADLEATERTGKSVREYLRSFNDYDSRPKIKALIEGR